MTLIALLLGLPAVTSAVLVAVPLADRRARSAGVVGSGATLAVAVAIAARFDYGRSGRMQDVVNVRWLSAIRRSEQPVKRSESGKTRRRTFI